MKHFAVPWRKEINFYLDDWSSLKSDIWPKSKQKENFSSQKWVVRSFQATGESEAKHIVE
jgi:hypothetical protein